MLTNIVRFAAGFFGLFLLLMGIRWLVDPAGAAEGLGMTLLPGLVAGVSDGQGLSTQIGDLASFFVVGGVFGLVGAIKRSAVLMLTPAALVLATAIFRTIAWTTHGAGFAQQAIISEVVMGVVFLLAYWRFSRSQD
ncbi:MAG: hypothetical protein AB8C02_10015 [Halioglobus sp.]